MAADQLDGSNGRVTLALLGAKIDTLSDRLTEYIERQDEECDDHEKRIRSLETDATRTRTLLGGWNMLLTAFGAWLASRGG
jgi:hypothetical protein